MLSPSVLSFSIFELEHCYVCLGEPSLLPLNELFALKLWKPQCSRNSAQGCSKRGLGTLGHVPKWLKAGSLKSALIFIVKSNYCFFLATMSKRSKNWTFDEEQLLVRLCKEQNQVLFGSFNSGQTSQQKKRAWSKIADDVSGKFQLAKKSALRWVGLKLCP